MNGKPREDGMNGYDLFADQLNELWDDVRALDDGERSERLLAAIDRAVTAANAASQAVRAQLRAKEEVRVKEEPRDGALSGNA
jgi:hypothetical protein